MMTMLITTMATMAMIITTMSMTIAVAVVLTGKIALVLLCVIPLFLIIVALHAAVASPPATEASESQLLEITRMKMRMDIVAMADVVAGTNQAPTIVIMMNTVGTTGVGMAKVDHLAVGVAPLRMAVLETTTPAAAMMTITNIQATEGTQGMAVLVLTIVAQTADLGTVRAGDTKMISLIALVI